jgi:hypothetical protein
MKPALCPCTFASPCRFDLAVQVTHLKLRTLIGPCMHAEGAVSIPDLISRFDG